MVKRLWLLSLAAYSGFIFYLSDQSSLPVPTLFLHQDKLFHATAYGGLAFLAINYFKYQSRSFQQALFVSFVFCTLYGLSDEWHQSFVEGRVADVFDWLADCAGVLIVLLAYKNLERRREV